MSSVYSDVMLRLESERDEARTAAQVQAAQIAALKVDLAAMQKHRDEALASAEASENVAEQRRERAKEAERALEAMKKEKDEALSKIKNMEVSANSLAKMMQEPLLTEMDALVARAERDAALFDLSQARAELDRLHEREKHFAKALSVADGGKYRADWDGAIARLIAERDAAVKAREEAEAQLAKVRHDRDEMIRVHDEVEADRDQLREENARLVIAYDKSVEAHAGTAALLGRAVDVMRRYMTPWPKQEAIHAVDAILADTVATAAADAYRAQQEAWAELEAVYEASKVWRRGELSEHAFRSMLAKVDARRGGGK